MNCVICNSLISMPEDIIDRTVCLLLMTLNAERDISRCRSRRILPYVTKSQEFIT